ncbi:hypothetical protein KAT92_01265, partial [Candidatus Babeliales bacterium]|nr:hypothetical protein [Candidatus Babeliales bacterium]
AMDSKTELIDVLLLTALPGSGKSEIRCYLSSLSPEECLKKFGIGETVAIDDFPYVYVMRCISDKLVDLGEEGAFYLSAILPFKDPRHWETLTHLINEDFADMNAQKKAQPQDTAEWLFDRIDAAYVKAGGQPILKQLNPKIRANVLLALKAEAEKLLKSKNAEIDKAKNLDGKTIVIEFSRGGVYASSMPLPAPYGYKHSLAKLSPEILQRASILYVEVSPEESRRKNEVRANPNDPGSILGHKVPLEVMLGSYGCDDMVYLAERFDRAGTVCIEAHGEIYHLPFGRFDNNVDKTTFARANFVEWRETDVSNLCKALTEAFAPLGSW